MGTQLLTPTAWDEPRWLVILERMEYRQAHVGLRFWGPPLWLEVTMSGPDSDAWSTAGALALPDQSWDWQSTEACDEAMGLAQAGATDEMLLGAASRYTVKNLILNATHEIGEWLRFDAQRPFAAHGHRSEAELAAQQAVDGEQGNGSVSVEVRFSDIAVAADEESAATTTELGDDSGQSGALALDRMAVRVRDLAAAWRFSYLPGKLISYGHSGPMITDSTVTPAIRWESTWSNQMLRLVAAPRDEFVAAVQREVHQMLVSYETQLICDAFYVDDRRAWRFDPGATRARPVAAWTGPAPTQSGPAPTQTGPAPVETSPVMTPTAEARDVALADNRAALHVTVTYDC